MEVKERFYPFFFPLQSYPYNQAPCCLTGPRCFGQDQNVLDETSYGISADSEASTETLRQLACAQGKL